MNKSFCKYIIIVLVYSCSSSASLMGQVRPSLQNDSTLTHPSIDSASVGLLFHPLSIDTVYVSNYKNILHEIRYEKATQYNRFNRVMGNNGQVYNSLLYIPQHYLLSPTFNYYADYFIDNQNIPRICTATPYTKVSYRLGSRLEQIIAVDFHRAISSHVKINMGFDRQTSKGYLISLGTTEPDNQKATATQAYINLIYLSKNLHWHSDISGAYLSQRLNLNGGILNDSIFNTFTPAQQVVAPTRLYNANAQFQQRFIEFTQIYRSGAVYDVKINDSLFTKNISVKNKFFYNFRYAQETNEYRDTERDSSYYTDFFFNNSATFDSANSYTYTNKVGWTKPTATNSYTLFNIKPMLFIQHQFYRLYSMAHDTAIQETSLHANFNILPSYNLDLKFNILYHIMGYNKNNYKVNANIVYPISSQWNIITYIERQQTNVPINWIRYKGNHDNWMLRTPINQQLLTWKLGAAIKKKFSIYYQQYNNKNILYLDSLAMPRQYASNLTIQQLVIQLNFHHRKLHFENYSFLQKISKNDVIQLPYWASYSSFYFTNQKNNTSLRYTIGVDLNGIGSMILMDYRPSLHTIYYSNTVSMPALVEINAYAGFNIKRFTAFIKGTNIARGIINKTSYYALLHQPIMPRALKIGISWQFYD